MTDIGNVDGRILRVEKEARGMLALGETKASVLRFLWDAYDALVKIGHVQRARLRDLITDVASGRLD